MPWRHGIERGGSRQQRQLFDRQPRHTLAVRPAERLAEEGDGLARARQSERLAGQFMHDTGRHFRLARQRTENVEAHHIAGAFPDRVDRRFPVMPRQNALLDVTIAAEALHRLIEKARRALAHPVFDGRRQQPHIGGFLGVNGRTVERPAQPHHQRDRRLDMQRHVRQHRLHQRLIGEMFLEHAAMPRVMQRMRQA